MRCSWKSSGNAAGGCRPSRRRLRERIGPDYGERPFVLITGHRRENFGSGFDQICDALATLAAGFPDHLFIYPVHLNPNVQERCQPPLGCHQTSV